MEKIKEFNNILKEFSIKAKCVKYNQFNNYFYYDLALYPGTKIRDIQKYNNELSISIRSPTKPNLKIMSELGVVRLEFCTYQKYDLKLFDLFQNYNIPEGIPCLLGQSIEGNKIWMDLSKNPHLLIAGTTGSGKSVLIHNIIANLINYNSVKLFLIDPKFEFNNYQKFSNIKVSSTYDYSLDMLDTLIQIMENRYLKLKNNLLDLQPIVIIIDEFADLANQDDSKIFAKKICQLAQKCRAARIHIILSTQRPSVDVITGAIKANFPVRIACKTASSIDSKIILDSIGAENLLGQGDALLKDNSGNFTRFQIAYTNFNEINKYFGDA